MEDQGIRVVEIKYCISKYSLLIHQLDPFLGVKYKYMNTKTHQKVHGKGNSKMNLWRWALGTAVKTLPEMSTSYIQCLDSRLRTSSVCSFLLMGTLWDSSDASSTCVPTTHMRDLDWVLGSWLWIGHASAAPGIWETKQQIQDLSVCLSLFLSLYLFDKQNLLREIFCLLVHSPKRLQRPGPRARTFFWSPTWVQGPKHLGYPPLLSQVH